MNFPLFIARRIGITSSHGNRTGTSIAIAGIAISFTIMLLSIAVVTGFKHEIQRKLVGFNSQISIRPFNDSDSFEEHNAHGISFSDTITRIIHDNAPDALAEVTILKPSVLKTDSSFAGVVLKGLTHDSPSASFLQSHLTEECTLDSIIDNPSSIIMSTELASNLGVTVGDRLFAHFIEPSGLRTRPIKVAALFNTHFSDFDNSIAFTPLSTLQKLCNVDSITGTEIQLSNIDDNEIDNIASNIYAALLDESIKAGDAMSTTPRLYSVSTIHTSCAMYYNWLNLLDTNVYVILILMAAISLFTLVSSLFIIILDKIRLIGILKALGATDSQIRKIFILLTEKLLIKGLILGNIISLSLLFAQKYFRLIPLNPDAYYLNYVPVEVSWTSIIIINISAIFISAVTLVIPSHIIASISPAKSIRFD